MRKHISQLAALYPSWLMRLMWAVLLQVIIPGGDRNVCPPDCVVAAVRHACWRGIASLSV